MDTVLSVVVLAAIALVVGGLWQWRRGEGRRQAVLMLVLAVVMIVNVLIWALPLKSSGTGGVDRAAEGGPGG